MTRKTFVIDTSVLLHDPKAITKFPDNDLVFPLTVVEELNAMKRFFDEKGKNARHVLRLFDSLKKEVDGTFQNGIELDNGATLRFVLDAKGDPSLPHSLTNNKVIMTAYSLTQKGHNVVFISKNFSSRIKAEALGVKTRDYESLKYSYDNAYKGIRKVEMEKNDIDLFYKNGFLSFEEENMFPNEYCVMTSPEKSSAVGKYNTKKRELEPLVKGPDHIWGIKPLNIEQRCALDLLLRDDINLVTLMGPAGTGKTLLALACGMRKVFDEGLYSKILISRPIVPLGKDIGYLPGTKEEKLTSWMQPIYDNLEFLCGSSNLKESTETLKWVLNSKKIEMEAVTYIRGRSLPKIFMIIDEAQNLTPHEVKTIISRAGKGTKVVLAGDPTQIDNPYLDKDSNGLSFTVGAFKNSPLFGHIFLDRTERSELAALAAEIM